MVGEDAGRDRDLAVAARPSSEPSGHADDRTRDVVRSLVDQPRDRLRDLLRSSGPASRDEVAGSCHENCLVMRFDGEGRCREFTECYLSRP